MDLAKVDETLLDGIVRLFERKIDAMLRPLNEHEPISGEIHRSVQALLSALPLMIQEGLADVEPDRHKRNPESDLTTALAARKHLVSYFHGIERARYAAYLRSPGWQRKRMAVLKRDNGICQACLVRTATEIHHLSYEHLGAEFAFELVSVCAVCHERLHGALPELQIFPKGT
jgi:hypothetical protein